MSTHTLVPIHIKFWFKYVNIVARKFLKITQIRRVTRKLQVEMIFS